jgi:hypothetical protein|tara:strand:+ start:640 stop:759 length:120 start_codon:yes stop_codon:yes gene_type:complete
MQKRREINLDIPPKPNMPLPNWLRKDCRDRKNDAETELP